MLDTYYKNQCRELINLLLVKHRSTDTYYLPDQFKNHRAAVLFQTVGQLVRRGKTIEMGGRLLDHDYQFSYYSSKERPKYISSVFPLHEKDDLFIVFPHQTCRYSLVYSFDANCYTLYDTQVYGDRRERHKIFELKLYDGMDVNMVSSMLTKAVFVYFHKEPVYS